MAIQDVVVRCELLAHHDAAAHRAALLAAIGGISQTLTHCHDRASALPTVLADLLAASGLISGALVMPVATTSGDLFEVATSAGVSTSLRARLDHLCKHTRVFADVAAAREPLVLGARDGAPAVHELIGASSGLVVPFIAGRECLGMLLLVSESMELGEPDWVAFARSMAMQIGQAFALSDALARLVELEARYRQADAAKAAAAEVAASLLAQLQQTQKLDAVGRLAGGVAHDFNNVLSVILSYGEMMQEELPEGSAMHGDLDEICRAGRRAADLTRQLLMFSRQQMVTPRIVDISEQLAELDKMLRRILGADVNLVIVPGGQLGCVHADPGSIEQLILNLVVNARDAMRTGGRLTIELKDVVLDDAYAATHLGVKAGRYVMIAVSDTGVGMDDATRARIFEPFFTTKAPGKGMGLGLSTVFGIVEQLGGSIAVETGLGSGTRFMVYLPRVNGVPDRGVSADAVHDSVRGTETILLVEDDDQVRAVARTILRKHGYKVIEASNAGEALLIAEGEVGIDLLLSDVVMPQMSGPELVKRLSPRRPRMRILCMSGYADDSIVRHGVLDGNLAFLAKPITADTLSRKVRDVLDVA